MNRNFAFKLCGELTPLASDLGFSVSRGDTMSTCISAGIELLDATEKVISYAEKRKITRKMERGLKNRQEMYEQLKKRKEEQTEEFLSRERSLREMKAGKLRRELSQELEELKRAVEDRRTKLQQNIEYVKRQEEIARKVRISAKAAIELISESLNYYSEDQVINAPIIADLQESLIQYTRQYNNFVRICC